MNMGFSVWIENCIALGIKTGSGGFFFPLHEGTYEEEIQIPRP